MLDQLADYSIPILHPVIVHFPVALSLVALLCASVWLIRDKEFWLRCTTYLEILAFVGAFFAVRTGKLMKEQSEGVPMVDRFVEYHETMGERALWFLGLTLVAVTACYWYTNRDMSRSGTRLSVRIITYLFIALAAFFAGMAGYIGGIMTWSIPA